MPAAGQPSIQLFGRKDSRDTQRALRFFKERRIAVSFVDITVRPPAPAELRRFASRSGIESLIDRDARAYREGGLGYLRMDADELLERLVREPALLRLPLVRSGARVTVGIDEAAWKAWLGS